MNFNQIFLFQELFRLYLPHYFTGGAEGSEIEKKKFLNKVDSNYMLNMKFHCVDCGKQDNQTSSTIVAKKVSKSGPSKLKTKHQQGKKNLLK